MWTPRLHAERLALIRKRYAMLCSGRRPGKLIDVVSVEPDDELDERTEPQLREVKQ